MPYVEYWLRLGMYPPGSAAKLSWGAVVVTDVLQPAKRIYYFSCSLDLVRRALGATPPQQLQPIRSPLAVLQTALLQSHPPTARRNKLGGVESPGDLGGINSAEGLGEEISGSESFPAALLPNILLEPRIGRRAGVALHLAKQGSASYVCASERNALPGFGARIRYTGPAEEDTERDEQLLVLQAPKSSMLALVTAQPNLH